MKLIILPPVWPSLLESAEWYELEQTGVGGNFLRNVDVATDAIQLNPFRFPRIHAHARRATVPQFPFGVFYVVRDDAIYVFKIIHLHRHPKHWKRDIPRKGRRLP